MSRRLLTVRSILATLIGEVIADVWIWTIEHVDVGGRWARETQEGDE